MIRTGAPICEKTQPAQPVATDFHPIHWMPADTLLGMLWWNRLTERQRREWMRRAGDTGIAADAWKAFKTGINRGRRTHVGPAEPRS